MIDQVNVEYSINGPCFLTSQVFIRLCVNREFSFKFDANPCPMRTLFLFCTMILLITVKPQAQIGINDDNSLPDNSAMLEVKSNNKGFLPPRMTLSEINAIDGPAQGLVVFCTDYGTNGAGSLFFFSGGAWYSLSGTCVNPGIPAEEDHLAFPFGITWNWSVVPGATGYRWNTVNDYGSSTDMGASQSMTENGLTCLTRYYRYVWAYNGCGNSQPVTLSDSTPACPWVCGNSITDDRDGRTYSTVQVGTQCWMAQNLNIGILNNYQSDNQTIEKFCYNNLESNCDVYGGLYQWNEMMQYVMTPGVRGICPENWHLPTDEELSTLTDFLGGPGVAGGPMKEAGTAHWASPNTGATNESGFTLLPGGSRDYLGSFSALGERGSLWSSTFNAPASFDCSWNVDLYYNSDDVVRQGGAMLVNAFNVRCVKD